MSQAVWASINPSTTSGRQLATLLNDFKNAVMSGLSGTSRPSQTTAGGFWIDTTNEGSPNFYVSFKYYTGSTDVEVFRVYVDTNAASVPLARNDFEVAKISADTAAALLKLRKNRVANNGQVLANDVIGEIQFIGRGNDSSNPISGRVRVIALDNMTATAAGAAMVFEGISENSTVLNEFMRIRNNRLGIGLVSPSVQVHARGTTGHRIEQDSANTTGAVLDLAKTRNSAGSGQVLNNDEIGKVTFRTTDVADAQAVTAQVLVKATEDQTGSARGNSLDIQTTKIGESSPSSRMIFGEQIESVDAHRLNAYQLVQQDVATSATIAALSATKAIVNFTGSTATVVQGINAAQATKTILVHNNSSANVTLAHQNGSATAANRLKLPSSRDITLKSDESCELFYSTVESRWKLKSGSGGSGGGGGAAVNWLEEEQAALYVIENDMETYQYEDALDQYLYTTIKVPSNYAGGVQIKLLAQFYSGDSSGTVLLQTLSTLIRNGVDAVSSTVNQRTSTNSAVTLSAGTVDEPQFVEFDLTSTTGQINGVSVSANDIIKVRLTRNTGADTATGAAKFLPTTSEATFN